MEEINNETQNVEKQTISSLDEISQIIKKHEIDHVTHFLIPSLKKEVPFVDINTSQQKRLVKSVIDSPVYNTEFIYTFREILKENCKDPSVNIDELTIIDKLILALNLRIKSIGDDAELEIETEENKTTTVKLDLCKILKDAYDNLQDITPTIVEDDYYKVKCYVPTVGMEYDIETNLRGKVSDIEIENVKELRNTIGDAFVGEILKYIKDIYIKRDDEEILIDLEKFSYLDRIKIIETFKSRLLKKIIDYINTVRAEADKIELVKFELNGESYERRMSIDGDFFIIS